MTEKIRSATVSRWLGAGALSVVVLAGAAGCKSSQPALSRSNQLRLLDDREMVPAPYVKPAEASVAIAAPQAAPPAASWLPPPAAAPANQGILPAAVIQNLDDPLLGDDLGPLDPPPAKAKPAVVKINAAPKLPEAPAAEYLSYTVQKGDSLWEIGRMYGVSYQELAAFNKMDPKGVLKVGSVLRIPPGGKAAAGVVAATAKPTAPAPSAATGGATSKQAIPADGTHTVEKGDSLWTISRKYGVAMDKLKEYNSLARDLIRPGQKLALTSSAAAKLPKAPAPSASKATTGSPLVPAAATSATAGGIHPAASPTGGPAPDKYQVVSGDNLWTISRKYGVSITKIRELNKLGPDAVLHIGQTLVLTDGGMSVAAPSPGVPAVGAAVMPAPQLGGAAPAAPAVEDLSTLQSLPHFVEPTDSLEAIAGMYNSKVEWILRANPTVKSNADLGNAKQILVPVKPIK